jgi:competence protein ComGC
MSCNNNKTIDITTIILFIVSILVMVLGVIHRHEINEQVNKTTKFWQIEAVKAGVARYGSDTNGMVKFEWVTNNVNVDIKH